MNQTGAGNHSQDVDENTCGAAKDTVNICEEELRGRCPGRNIKKVDIALRMQQYIQKSGSGTEKCEEREDRYKALRTRVCLIIKQDEKADENKNQMPDHTMKGQCPVAMENAGRIDKGCNSSHCIEIQQKGAEYPALSGIMYQWEQWTEIHGQAAQLKWK